MTPPTPKERVCPDCGTEELTRHSFEECCAILKQQLLEAQAERDAWELSSTNWQADCRVAQSQLAAERAVIEAAKAWEEVEILAYHMEERQNAEGALVRAVDALRALEGDA